MRQIVLFTCPILCINLFWHLKYRFKILWVILTEKLIKELSHVCGLTQFVNLSRNRTWRRWILLRRMLDGNTKCPWQRYLQQGPAKLPRLPGKWNITFLLRTQVRGVINRILNVVEKKILNRRIVGKISVDVRFFHHVWLTGVVKLQVKPYLLKNTAVREIHMNTDPEKALFLLKNSFLFPKLLCTQT